MSDPSTAPANTAPRLRTFLRAESAWLAFTVVVCAHFALIYDWSNRPFLNLQRYTDGLESSPFQERVLMAAVFRIFARAPVILRVASHLPEQLHNPYIFIQLLVSFFAILGAVAFTRGSLRVLTLSTSFSRWAALLVVFMAYFNLVLIYGPSFTLPYDVPSLFFFSGCLYFLLRRQYLPFYFLFTLGVFNRETICFATLLFLIWQRTPSPSNPVPAKWSVVAPHIVAQLLIWVAIKFYLGRHFAFNPQEHDGTGLFVPHLRYNLHEVFKPQQWPLMLSNFGFTLPLLISQRRWIQQPAISRMCLIVLPAWLLLMLYVGVIIEIRIFTELIAVVSLAVGLIIFHRLHSLRSDAREIQANGM